MKSSFKPNKLFSNPHLQTILPHLFRNVTPIEYRRERFTVSDNDFVDLDWSTKHSFKKVCLILHGLESSSTRGYIYGMVRALNDKGFDAVVLNFRGCSGETNKEFKSYSSGHTTDVFEVLQHINATQSYEETHLIGFSLGGNVALKLAGEYADELHSLIKKVATISVPCDLHASAIKLQSSNNKLYHDRFLSSLKEKIYDKVDLFPDRLKKSEIDKIQTLVEFDDYYTAPAFGFKDAIDFYTQSSSKQFIPFIRNNTLIVTAKDDPFFTDECMPRKESHENKNVTFLNPEKGGHVGFMEKIKSNTYWHERIVLSFLEQ